MVKVLAWMGILMLIVFEELPLLVQGFCAGDLIVINNLYDDVSCLETLEHELLHYYDIIDEFD